MMSSDEERQNDATCVTMSHKTTVVNTDHTSTHNISSDEEGQSNATCVTGPRKTAVVSSDVKGPCKTAVVSSDVTGPCNTAVVSSDVTGPRKTAVISSDVTGPCNTAVVSSDVTGPRKTAVISCDVTGPCKTTVVSCDVTGPGKTTVVSTDHTSTHSMSSDEEGQNDVTCVIEPPKTTAVSNGCSQDISSDDVCQSDVTCVIGPCKSTVVSNGHNQDTCISSDNEGQRDVTCVIGPRETTVVSNDHALDNDQCTVSLRKSSAIRTYHTETDIPSSLGYGPGVYSSGHILNRLKDQGQDKGQGQYKGQDLYTRKRKFCDKSQTLEENIAAATQDQSSCLSECTVCLRLFSSQDNLVAHMMSHRLSHLNKMCAGKVMGNNSSEQSFQREITVRGDEEKKAVKSCFINGTHQNKFLLTRINCGLCSKDFKDRGRLFTHIQKYHGNHNTTSSSRSDETSGDNLSSTGGLDSVACYICGKVMISEQLLQVHLDLVHRENHLLQCSRSFEQVQLLMKNEQLHEESTVDDVSSDNKTMCTAKASCTDVDSVREVTLNSDRNHSEGRCQCLHCRIYSKDCESFQNHGSTDSGVCDLGQGQKVQSCPVCHKLLKTNMKDHIRIHSGERPFSCPSCPARFKRNHQLNVHMQSVHSDVAQFQCEICGKSFKRRDKLLSNQRTHSDEHPYMCIECGSVFKWKHHLKRHKDYVHGDKIAAMNNGVPFSCEFCGREFKWKHHMKRHIRNVHGIRSNMATWSVMSPDCPVVGVDVLEG